MSEFNQIKKDVSGEFKNMKERIKHCPKSINKRRLCFYIACILSVVASFQIAQWPDTIGDRLVNTPFLPAPTELFFVMIFVMLDVYLVLFLVGLFFVPKTWGVYICLVLLSIPPLLFLVFELSMDGVVEGIISYIYFLTLGMVNIPMTR